MDVAIIQPSYANAVATTAVSNALPVEISRLTTLVKFSTVIPLHSPTTVPTIAIRYSGISLMTVVAT